MLPFNHLDWRAPVPRLSTIKSRSRRPRLRKVSISIFVDPNKIRRQIDRGNLTARPYGGPGRPDSIFDKTQAVLLANKEELQ